LEDRLGGDDFQSVDEDTYGDVTRSEAGIRGKHHVAVVHAYGDIGGRESRSGGISGSVMGHETVIDDLRSAEEDDNAKAIIFRVDSPGGESLASELIAREVARIAKKKPIIVSMGNVAASGGYAISYRGTRIVADSLTITGSIGSIFGKMNIAGLWNKAGVTFDSVTRGPNALFFSEFTDFDPDQWKRVEEYHNASFDLWLKQISESRKIPVDDLRKISEGRVWTGRQAVANHLIDDAGGWQKAVDLAKEEAKLPADDPLIFDHYPRKVGIVTLLSSGKAPITIARLMITRWMHTDFAETKRLLLSGESRLYTGPTRVQ
jgi:protease-4